MVGPDDDHEPPPPSRLPVARTRPAKYAGSHYPADPTELRQQAEAALGRPEDRRDGRALGLVVPHGPWSYVAAIAGAAIGRYAVEETVIILAPNHAGRGPRSAIVCDGAYALPGSSGIVIEQSIAESIRALGGLAEAPEVFVDEHAIEDVLPLLAARQSRLTIVPIAIHDVSASSAARIGAAIADATVGRGGGVTLLATTDLAHYVPAAALANESAQLAEHARTLNDEALVDVFRARLRGPGPILETCGLGALLTFVHAMRALSAGPGELCARGSSLDKEKDARAGVAWASLAWPRA
jgi:MEMO1 family protein